MRRLTVVALAAAAQVYVAPTDAASPEYCAFYAREYARQFAFGPDEAATERRISDQAYYRCLNQDEDPPLPDASAYAGGVLDAASEAEPPVAQGDADPDAEVVDAVEEEPVSDEEPAQQTARRTGQKSRSGLTPWSAEWFAWCRKHFPNSFDPETGFVRPYRGSPGFC